MLEDKNPKFTVPSIRDMPALLIFRRVSYRLYPKGQVVGLYYSKNLDKYLSIPFGPGGNLNLSEAQIVEDWRETVSDIGKSMPGYEDKEESKKKWKEGDYVGAAKSQGKALGKAALTGAAVAGAAGLARVGIGAAVRSGLGQAALKYAKKKVFGGSDEEPKDNEEKSKDDGDKSATIKMDAPKEKPHAKVYSSWENRPESNPIYQSKLRQSSLAPVKENKISDLRKMVNEGVETKNLRINGRQVTLNTTMAKRILEVYDSVNTKNKKIVEGMLNEDLESFKKLLNFTIRN
jgi:hypothetical protein